MRFRSVKCEMGCSTHLHLHTPGRISIQPPNMSDNRGVYRWTALAAGACAVSGVARCCWNMRKAAPTTTPAPTPTPTPAQQAQAAQAEALYEATLRVNDLYLKAKLAVDTVHSDQLKKALGSGSPQPARSPALSAASEGTVPRSPEVSPARLPPSEDEVQEAMQERIRGVAERAFWDVLREELSAVPPQQARVPGVLGGLQEQLISMTPKSQQAALSSELQGIAWDDLVTGIFMKDTLRKVLGFFMDKVAALEAEAANASTVLRVKEVQDRIDAEEGTTCSAGGVVSVLTFARDEMTALEKSIAAARKKLFAPLLAREAGLHLSNLHGEELAQKLHSFSTTRDLLHKTMLLMLDKTPGTAALPLTCLSAEDVRARHSVLYNSVAREAILRLVFFPLEAQMSLPESLAVQKEHLRNCCDLVQKATVTAALATVCGMVTQRDGAVAAVASSIVDALSEPGATVASVATETVAHVDAYLIREGRAPLAESQCSLLKGMVVNVAKPDDKLYATYHARLVSVAAPIMLSGLPEGHTTIASALHGTPFAHIAPLVGQLVVHTRVLMGCNVAWYRSIVYDAMLNDIASTLDLEGI